jgi:NADH-quinone oxidoreductase subunit N
VAAFATLLPLHAVTSTTFGGAFANDKFSWGFDALLIFTLAVTLAISALKRADDGGSPAAYAALLIFCTVGGMVLAGATNLIAIFLGIEQLSLALYLLAGTGFPRPASQEASLKYVLLGSFASGFLIYGSALLYGATGSIFLRDMPAAAAAPSPMFLVGLGLFFVGLAFKLALSPFHIWTPDVYEGSPLAVTGYMAVAVKVAVFAVLARFVYTVFGHDSVALTPLWMLAIASMIVGNVGAIRQRNLKRLLGFSSIAQAGYVVVALVGVKAHGLSILLFYLSAYAFMNLGAFAIVALVGDGDEAYADLDAYRGLFFSRPWIAALMALFFMSLAGIPATAGFMGKFFLLAQAVTAGPWGVALAVTLVAGTLVSFYVYFKVIWEMAVRVEGEAPAVTGNSWVGWAAAAVGAAGTILLGVLPQIFYTVVASL